MFNILSSFLLASHLFVPSLSCDPRSLVKRQTAAGPSYPTFRIGTDPPSDVATVGFKIAHIALFVNDIEKTRHFYGDILGMRQIFRLDATNDYSILYMGHSAGGKNGTGYMTGDELVSELYNMQGLMEFIYLKASHLHPVLIIDLTEAE